MREARMDRPWVSQYDPGMKQSVSYPDKTMYEMLARTVERFPSETAVSFEGTGIRYKELLLLVDQCAASLLSYGVRTGSVVTVCLPNTPHAVVVFYAINRIGAVANMVHPKTPPEELRHFLQSTGSDMLFILDAFLKKQVTMIEQIHLSRVIVARIGDFLSPIKSVGFYAVSGRKIPAIPSSPVFVSWKSFLRRSAHAERIPYQRAAMPGSPSVFLHSGGTTGLPKTIVLSSYNFNVLAVHGPMIVNIPDPFLSGIPPRKAMVTILPLFHGFGLCMGMHTMMCNAITALLIPQFEPETLAQKLLREKPAFIAAVPTLFEGILRSEKLKNADLSFLECCFCGGDSLTADLKERFETFLRERGADISLREGYGLTETVTVCCVNPQQRAKPDSVGLPLPDIDMKIVKEGTEDEMPTGEQGEILVSGPTVMLGYLGDPAGTAEAIHTHRDGRKWVHTGDFGFMDESGYFHFTQRLKRIIKVSGVPVFPSQIEEVISGVEGVKQVCAVPVPDPYRIHIVKAFVVPEGGKEKADTDKVERAIRSRCESALIPYARPVEFEFRDELPLTLVGKVDYRALEAEEESRRRAAALS